MKHLFFLLAIIALISLLFAVAKVPYCALICSICFILCIPAAAIANAKS